MPWIFLPRPYLKSFPLRIVQELKYFVIILTQFSTPLLHLGRVPCVPVFLWKKPDPCIYVICEAFGLHLGGISLILPTPGCYYNYSREGIESVSSYCQLLSLCILLFPPFVSRERRSLTSGKESVPDNEQDPKGGTLEGLACDSVEWALWLFCFLLNTLLRYFGLRGHPTIWDDQKPYL